MSKNCDARFSEVLLIESPKKRPPWDGFRRNEVDNGECSQTDSYGMWGSDGG